MMDAWQENIVSRKAKEIRDKMLGGAIYGVPITGDAVNIDVMIVAAYHMGRSEEMKESNPQLLHMIFKETV